MELPVQVSIRAVTIARIIRTAVLLARLIQQIVQTACVRIGSPITICRFTSAPLPPVLCVSVGHKVHIAVRLGSGFSGPDHDGVSGSGRNQGGHNYQNNQNSQQQQQQSGYQSQQQQQPSGY